MILKVYVSWCRMLQRYSHNAWKNAAVWEHLHCCSPSYEKLNHLIKTWEIGWLQPPNGNIPASTLDLDLCCISHSSLSLSPCFLSAFQKYIFKIHWRKVVWYWRCFTLLLFLIIAPYAFGAAVLNSSTQKTDEKLKDTLMFIWQ